MRLELDSVCFSRSGRPAVVVDADLIVDSGSITSILGPNGAGKTTLLGLASGRLRPVSGKILLDSVPVGSIAKPVLARKLAVLPQFEKLPFNYSCFDFVLLGRAPHVHPLSMPGPADRDAAIQALNDLGLVELADRPTGELSGGEFQLVRFARCLAQEATILLLDEPTSMLDPANARQVADTLVRLAGMGKAILFATHDVALAGWISDRVVLMGKGRMDGSGSPSEILYPARLQRTFGVEFGIQTVPGVFSMTAGAELPPKNAPLYSPGDSPEAAS